MNEVYLKEHWKRNVAFFLAGQGITLIGSSLVGYAIMWHVTLKTQSGVMMTLFTVATMLPIFFISPFGGVWADRFNKKYLINIADGCISIVTLIIALCYSFGIEHLGLLFVCAVVRSLGQGVQMPAVNALIPQLVPEEQLVRVNGINGSIQSLSTLGSPAIAGVLLNFAPIQTILFIDIVTATIGITVLLVFVKVPLKSAEESELANAKSYLNDMKSGMVYIREHRFIMRLFIIVASLCILLTPAMLLSPLQVVRDFGAEVWRLTAVEIAFSVGMLIGGVTISVWGGFSNKIVTTVVGTSLLGITTIGLGIFENFWIYLACVAISGATVPLFNTPVMVILQLKVDGDFRGRVLSAMTMITSISVPFGMLIFGPLGDIVIIDFLMIGTGVGTIVLSAYMLLDKKLIEAGA